jgi:pimeloyl-ACP methyl ester carboxylesterase
MCATLRTTIVGTPTSAASPVVFLHGWPDDSRVWRPLLPAFSDRRCVLLDLPRCDGEAWEGANLGFDMLACLAAAAIQKEQRPVIVVAHDWGACVAGLLLSSRPELIERLVLLDVGKIPNFFNPRRPTLLLHGASIVGYQSVNALIYLLGLLSWLRPLADRLNALWVPRICSLANSAEEDLLPLLTATLPALLRPRRWQREDYGRPISSQINYFYFHAPRFVSSESFRKMKAALDTPSVPLLFLYGTGAFHDELWEAKLASPEWDQCDAVRIERGHWFFVSPAGAKLTASTIQSWIGRTTKS